MKYSIFIFISAFLTNIGDGKKANGKTCSKNSKCESDHCCRKIPWGILKRCQECCGNQDCGSDEICSSGRVCVDDNSSGGGGTDPDLKPNGKTCTKNSKCQSGLCFAKEGGIIKRCQECCADENCQDGFTCSDSRVCVDSTSSGNPIGGYCRKDEECTSMHCCGFLVGKRCRECCNNKDCDTGCCKGKICLRDVQFSGSCSCGGDKVCDQTTGPHGTLRCCKEGKDMCKYCCKDSDCQGNPDGQYCGQSGYCTEQKPAGGDCEVTQDCQGGLTCCQGDNKCHQCCDDGLTNLCGDGLYCQSFSCQFQQNSGFISDCVNDYECLSNLCVSNVCKSPSGSACFNNDECLSNDCGIDGLCQ